MIHQLNGNITIPFYLFKQEASLGRGVFEYDSSTHSRFGNDECFSNCLKNHLKEHGVEFVSWLGEKIKIDCGSVVSSSDDSQLGKYKMTMAQIQDLFEKEIHTYYHLVAMAEFGYLRNQVAFPDADDFAKNLIFGTVSRMLQMLRIEFKDQVYKPDLITIDQGDAVQQALGINVYERGFCKHPRELVDFDLKKLMHWLRNHFNVEKINNEYCESLADSVAKYFVDKKDYKAHSAIKFIRKSFDDFQTVLFIIGHPKSFEWAGTVASYYEKVKVQRPVIDALQMFLLKNNRAAVERYQNLSERGML